MGEIKANALPYCHIQPLLQLHLNSDHALPPLLGPPTPVREDSADSHYILKDGPPPAAPVQNTMPPMPPLPRPQVSSHPALPPLLGPPTPVREDSADSHDILKDGPPPAAPVQNAMAPMPPLPRPQVNSDQAQPHAPSPGDSHSIPRLAELEILKEGPPPFTQHSPPLY